jgi:uncharacterized repeat protein (TIGR01451 family)
MKRSLAVSTALLAALLSTTMWTGCASWGTQEEQTYNAGEGAGRTEVPRYQGAKAAPKAEAAVASNEFTLKSDLLQVTKRVPAKATLGSDIEADLTIVAVANCANIMITDMIPAGSTYVKSEPPAQVDGKKLTWSIDTMDRGQTINAKIWYTADSEGSLVNCATMAAIPRGCAATFVGKAQIAIDKTGPEMAKLGAQVNYSIVVKNTGNADANDVVVTDTVPDGLSSDSGQSTLTFNVGTLAPGQSKEIPVALKAAARGKHCNDASVATSNAGSAKSEACTLVVQPGLKIDKTGTKEQFLGRNANYEIVVANTGDTTLTGVSVTDTAPAETRIVSASGASISGVTATWQLSELRAGDKKTLDITLTSDTPGSHCNAASANDASDNLSDSAQACTLWKGIPAILLETRDDPDPVEVGGTVIYTIRVTNQGTADDNNIKVVAAFGNEVDPVSASSGGQVNGKTVTFPVLPALGPKQVETYTITAKGVAVGDHRMKVSLTSDMLTEPVTHEESTHVY